MTYPNHMNATEALIINAILKAALEKSYMVSVFDGEEWALKKSTDINAIRAEVAATCETVLLFRDSEAKNLGRIIFIHGNGADVVHDHSDNEVMAALVEASADLGVEGMPTGA